MTQTHYVYEEATPLVGGTQVVYDHYQPRNGCGCTKNETFLWGIACLIFVPFFPIGIALLCCSCCQPDEHYTVVTTTPHAPAAVPVRGQPTVVQPTVVHVV